jgi:hypothetical protein
VGKKEILHSVVRNVNSCSHCGNPYVVPQKIKNRSYDPVIPLLGIYPKESKTAYYSYTCMFIVSYSQEPIMESA